MNKIIKDITDLNYYRFNSEYRKLKNKLDKLNLILLDKEIEVFNLKKEIYDLSIKLQEVEINILKDIEAKK